MDSAEIKNRMQAAVDHLQEELQSVRTGRANTALVENVSVKHYGQSMPLKSLANITAPDAKSIVIAPWDPSAIDAIEKAISEDPNLGLTPTSDGKAVYINVPPLTEERRQQMVKQVSDIAEQAHVSLRNIRHDALKNLQNQLKDKAISEDEFEDGKKQLDTFVQDFGAQVDTISGDKKQDVLKV